MYPECSAHKCSHKCARTKPLAHGVFGCMCGAATETVSLFGEVPWGVFVGKSVAGCVFRVVCQQAIPGGTLFEASYLTEGPVAERAWLPPRCIISWVGINY